MTGMLDTKNKECEEGITVPKAQHRLSMIDTPSRPYLKWLKEGVKTAEGRINTPACQKMRVGDSIVFWDKQTGHYIYGTIVFKHEYDSFEEMLCAEGVRNMLPFLENQNIAEGVKVYQQFPGSERVTTYGCVAIGLIVLESRL